MKYKDLLYGGTPLSCWKDKLEIEWKPAPAEAPLVSFPAQGGAKTEVIISEAERLEPEHESDLLFALDRC